MSSSFCDTLCRCHGRTAAGYGERWETPGVPDRFQHLIRGRGLPHPPLAAAVSDQNGGAGRFRAEGRFRRRRDGLRSRSAQPHRGLPRRAGDRGVASCRRAKSSGIRFWSHRRMPRAEWRDVLCIRQLSPTHGPSSAGGEGATLSRRNGAGQLSSKSGAGGETPHPTLSPPAGRGSERMAGRGEPLSRQRPRPRRRRRGKGEVFALGPRVPIGQRGAAGVWVGGGIVDPVSERLGRTEPWPSPAQAIFSSACGGAPLLCRTEPICLTQIVQTLRYAIVLNVRNRGVMGRGLRREDEATLLMRSWTFLLFWLAHPRCPGFPPSRE